MNRAWIITTIALLVWLATGCAEGTMTVDPEELSVGDDAGVDAFSQDTHAPDDTGTSSDTDPDPGDTGDDCCSPGDVECAGDGEYIECIADDDNCGHWTDPLTCSSDTVCDPSIDAGDPCVDACTDDHPDHGEPCSTGVGVCENEGTNTCEDGLLVCDAEAGEPEPKQCNGRDSNCDGEVDSEGICGPCEDDEFAPDNFSNTGAAELSVGTTHDDLTLCDNEDAGASQNWFYLGEIDEVHVHLQWEELYGPLGLDIYTADSAGAAPSWHADAGTDDSELSHSESLEPGTATYARVFFRAAEDDKPPAGAPYSIAHDD